MTNGRRAGMGQQRLGSAGPMFDPLMAALRKRAIAGDMEIPLCLGHIEKLLPLAYGWLKSIGSIATCSGPFLPGYSRSGKVALAISDDVSTRERK
jgi:hypothetical protein